MLVFIETGYGGHLSPYTDSTVLQVLDAVVSISFFFALLVTFLAGLFSRGIQRIGLVCCSVVVSLMLLLTIARHFWGLRVSACCKHGGLPWLTS